MKTFSILLLVITLSSFITTSSPSSVLPKNYINSHFVTRVVHVDWTLTSTAGCSVHIVGDVEFTIIPPKFIGFTGTVTISGPKGCPNGTLTFAKTPGGDLMVSPNVDDVCNLSEITWSGSNNDFVDKLNESGINNSIVTELNALCNE